MILDIKNGNYDYLHGALGVRDILSHPFLPERTIRYFNITPLRVRKIRNHIVKTVQIKWISNLNIEGKKGCNISLSHGMSSIAAFLIRLHQKKF